MPFKHNLQESGTELGALIAQRDWSSTVGRLEDWPRSLQTLTLFLVRSPVPIVLLWGEAGYMIYNDSYSRFAGGRHPQLLGSAVREGWPEVADFNDNVMKVGLGGGTLEYRGQKLTLYRHGKPDEVWMDLDYSPVMDDDAKVGGVICILTEITERVAALEALQATRDEAMAAAAEHTAILSQLSEGVIVTDSDGRISFVNEAAERLHGVKMLNVPPEDYSDKYHLLTEQGEYYPPRELPLARAVLDDAIVTDARWRIRKPDGEEVLAIGSAKPIYLNGDTRIGSVLTIRDDTERSASEAQLRETEERYRLVARATNDAVWDWDLVTNHVRWNEALFSVFGYERAEVEPTGEWWVTHIEPADRERVSDSIHTAIEGTADHWAGDYCFLNASGESVHVFDRGYIIRDGSGKAVRMIGAMLDQTERHRAEQALHALNEGLEQKINEAMAERALIEEALRQAQKMEAVGQLTGGIAHDFNNMLAVISGSLELLNRRVGAEDARSRRYIDSALEGSRRAANLTQRLLAFSRQQPLRPEILNVNALVAGMSELFRHSIGADIRLETVLAGGLWSVNIDANQLENILLNLAVNARDAMPGGGRLTIETQNAHLDARYVKKEPGVSEGSYVLIAVTDSGSGMSPEVMARAFDPFFTTKDVGKGTGLGLSQVYGFVKQSGGHIKVYSESGQGTTIKIYLPRHHAGAAETLASEADETLPGGEGRELILVVDDEALVRQFSVDALSDLGYRVLEADGAETALSLLKDTPGIDLLFTDIVMPDVNGRKLADQAQDLRPGLLVFYTTGYTRNAVVHNGMVDEGVELIGKPFTLEDLALKVRHMFDAAALRERR